MDNHQKILGVDFDDTLFTGGYPNSVKPNWPVIDYVKKRKSKGWKIVLITCRHDEKLEEALKLCEQYEIPIDAANVNSPELIEEWGDCRKIYCDEYIDDKNISLRELRHLYYRQYGKFENEG